MKRSLLFYVGMFISLFSFSQNTYVPNDSFEQALIDLGYDSGPLDDYVPTANINTVTVLDIINRSIDPQFNPLDDLTGIEDFIALTHLNCSENFLTELDVSHNKNLEYLSFHTNSIKEIDLSNNKSLKRVICFFNLELTDLYFGFNDSLESIMCEQTSITSLDLSRNGFLKELSLINNELTSLNLKNKNFLPYISLRGNPNLTCIEVDNLPYAQANWYIGDTPNAAFSLSCSSERTYVPDNNFEQTLIDLGYDDVLDNYVLRASIETISSLDVSDRSIKQLTGIEDFINLTMLNCSNNLLVDLYFKNNNKLVELDCSDNNLIYLNVNNDNNENFTIFNAVNNSNLTCIDVDNENYSTSNWLNIDSQTLFSENCNPIPFIYVPDDNFEKALIDLGLDDGLDDLVSTNNISSIIALDISNKNISDLTGIEGFINLENLICGSNPITILSLDNNLKLENLNASNIPSLNLDISENVMLKSLDVSNGNLLSIDLSKNTNLEILNVSYNSLTALDVSNNVKLKQLYIEYNQLSTIDLSNNNSIVDLYCYDNKLVNLNLADKTKLEYLLCLDNKLTALNLKNTNSLKQLVCDNNSLISLDLSSSSSLISLFCHNNNLERLNVKNGNNGFFQDFVAIGNPNLMCVQVDSEVYSANNWGTGIDAQTNFSEDCLYETSIPDNNFEQALINLGYDVGPIDNLIPTNSIESIENLSLENIGIADLTGIEDFTSLTSLDCTNNELENLDLSQNLLLSFLETDNNKLNSLNVKNGNNINFTDFNTSGNPNLTCVQVDNVTYSTANWTNVDIHTIFSEEDCSTLSNNEFNTVVFSFYPNPTKQKINIDIQQEADYRIFTLEGKQVHKGRLDFGENELDISNLRAGIYFLNLRNETFNITKKIVKL